MGCIRLTSQSKKLPFEVVIHPLCGGFLALSRHSDCYFVWLHRWNCLGNWPILHPNTILAFVFILFYFYIACDHSSYLEKLPHPHTLERSCYTYCLYFLKSHYFFSTFTLDCQNSFYQGLLWPKSLVSFLPHFIQPMHTWNMIFFSPHNTISPWFSFNSSAISQPLLSDLQILEGHRTLPLALFFVFKVFIDLVFCLTYITV